MKQPKINNICVKTMKRIVSGAKKKAHIILGVTAGAGYIYSGFLAVKATPKAEKLISAKKEELGVDDISLVDKIRTAGPCYIPAISIAAASTGCLIGSLAASENQIKKLEAACTLSSAALTTYKGSIEELFSKEDVEKIEDSVAKKEISQIDTKIVVGTEEGEIFSDSLTGQIFWYNGRDLATAVSDVNYSLMSEPYMSLEEVYQMMGLPTDSLLCTTHGYDLADGPLKIMLKPYTTFDGRLCWRIRWNRDPELLEKLKRRR